ncbi:MAG: hypothetical protein LBI79_08300 [Nitrososphaerota archaeon]|nr:hypothetical protein [Nitrososphaerota archaeon]
MDQPLFKCPHCDAPPWHSRMMFWKHIHECLQSTPQIIQEGTISAIVISKEELVATTATAKR